MISWRCIGLVLLFSVSSLLAADQFPARPLDREVGNDPARERVLVMHDGTVQRGLIEKTMTGYVLTKPQGKLVFAFDRVRLMADDLPAAYREQSKACANQALPRIELGRWCFANGLNDEARKELRKALSLEPESQLANNLLQIVDDKLMATRELPRVKVGQDGSFSMLGDAKGLATVEPLGGLPRGAAQEFASRVQPLLVNRCATAGCHGPGSKQDFQLHRIKVGQRASRSQVEKNLSSVLDRIDRDRPLSSPLLMKLRGEPQANGLRISHGSLSPEQMHTVRRWIVNLSNKPLDVLPVSVELPEPKKPPVAIGKPVVESPAEVEIPEQLEPPVTKSSIGSAP